MDDDSSASSDHDFMSPFASLREIFPTPKIESETLTATEDSSFLGARMSPIVFDEDDERNEDREAIAPYRKALHESVDSSFSNERTSLLGRRPRRKPLWDEEKADRNVDTSNTVSKERPRCSWDIVLCAISGIHLTCMALYDLYAWYVSYRLGGGSNVAWRLPLLSPTPSTLIRFGALIPWNVFHGQPWRIITSTVISTSLVEYLFLYGAWHALRVGGSRPTNAWVGLYFMSTLTGQLWTTAWDPLSVSGGASWGTCGVLCAAGAAKPRQRFLLLVISISLFLISLVDTRTNSFMGTLGSSAFGCAYYGVGYILVFSRDVVTAVPPTKSVRQLSGVVILSLWLIPVLWIAQTW